MLTNNKIDFIINNKIIFKLNQDIINYINKKFPGVIISRIDWNTLLVGNILGFKKKQPNISIFCCPLQFTIDGMPDLIYMWRNKPAQIYSADCRSKRSVTSTYTKDEAYNFNTFYCTWQMWNIAEKVLNKEVCYISTRYISGICYVQLCLDNNGHQFEHLLKLNIALCS